MNTSLAQRIEQKTCSSQAIKLFNRLLCERQYQRPHFTRVIGIVVVIRRTGRSLHAERIPGFQAITETQQLRATQIRDVDDHLPPGEFIPLEAGPGVISGQIAVVGHQPIEVVALHGEARRDIPGNRTRQR
jgi:hypothetical protein